MVALQDDAYTRALRDYFRALPKPKAIVIVSAHTTLDGGEVEVITATKHRAFHDFRGFPGELYQIEYSPPGDAALAARILGLVSTAGYSASLITRPMDHGMWIPLRIAYPDADIPVVPVSLPYPGKAEESLKLGQALSSLRDEGVMIIGSGGLVHNLGRLVWSGKEGAALDFASEFNDWAFDRLKHKDVWALTQFETEAPRSSEAHPTADHYLPLLFTLGASLPGDELQTIYRGIEYASLSMDCYALEAPGPRTLN